MPRPRRMRRIGFWPSVTHFKPVVKGRYLESILTMDEMEAIRLKDYEDMEQEQAAKKMKISQPTFHRLIESARKRVAEALVNGKAIRIEGGVYEMMPGRGLGRGSGRGRMGGFGLGPSGECVCPSCGHRMSHPRGVPCYQQKCPKCGTMMTRGG